MKKVLLTGDIHIFDYPSHRLMDDSRFRLNQFPKLAMRLVDIGRKQGCTDIIIAGDIMHHSIFEPHIGHIAKTFFRTISEGFENVYYILGQHDINTRAQEKDYEDSLVGIIADFNNVHYMNKKTTQIGGRKFAFNDWQPSQDWDWVPSDTDVMIGHVTISDRFGQEFDTTKYKIGFFGDIHAHGTYLNNVKIGVPIQHSLGDNPDVGVVVLNTDNMEWHRVSTIEKGVWDFLQILHAGETPTVSEEYVRFIDKTPQVQTIKATIGESYNLLETVEESIVENELQDVHATITNNTKEMVVDDELNLDFDLTEIVIKNFRSIADFTWTFTGGVTLLTGSNGSGKSSLMRAIHHAFLPSRSFPIKIDTTEGFVDLTFKYQGTPYRIIRGTQGVKFYINEELQTFENQNVCNGVINNTFPFIKFLHLLYHHQRRPGLLSSYSVGDRLDIIQRAVGLNKLTPLNTTAKTMLDKMNKRLDEIKTTKGNLESFINSMSEFLDLASLEVDYGPLKAQAIKTRDQLTELLVLNRDLNNANVDVDKITGIIDAYQKSLSGLSIEEGVTEESILASIKTYRTSISEAEAIITATNASNAKIVSDKNKGDQILTKLTTELKSVESRISKVTASLCHTCEQEIDADKRLKLLSDLNAEKDELNNKIVSAQSIISKLPSQDTMTIPQKTVEISGYQNLIAQLNSTLTRLKEVAKIQQEIAVKIEARNKALESSSQLKSEIAVREISLTVSTEGAAAMIQSLNEEIAAYNQKIATQESTRNTVQTIDKKKDEVSKLESEFTTLGQLASKYLKYFELTSNSGPIVHKVMENVSKLMSDNEVEITTFKVLKSKEVRPDLSVRLKVDNIFINYDELSGGQQVFADMVFLTKLLKMIGKAGLLILDETLKEVSRDRLETLVQYLHDSPVGNMFISTHVDSFNFYDNHLSAQLVNNSSHYVRL